MGHHLKVLENAGLVRVVRTEMVRAIEARYYGRTARTFDITPVAHSATHPNLALATAIKEMSESSHGSTDKGQSPGMSTVRHARIPEERAQEWQERLLALVEEFIASPRDGDIVYGLVIALYPTDRPHLP